MPDGGYNPGAKGLRELLQIEFIAARFGLIAHIEGKHQGHPKLFQLDRKIQVALQI